jgi:UDP-glucose 4-epimerase
MTAVMTELDLTARLRGRRVLVAGASGFIGRAVCERLVHRGAETVGVSRHVPTGITGPIEQVEWRQVDLVDDDAARRLIAEVQPHAVINLAGVVAGSRDRSFVIPTLHTNLGVAVTLLDAAAESGCCEAFVQAGSLEEPNRRDESPSSPYSAAKSAATSYTQLYAQRYGLNCGVARIFMVYGPGHQDETKLIPFVIRNGLLGSPIQLSSGRRRVDWVYIDDVADALVMLASNADLGGESVDIGSGELVPIRDVVTQLWELLGLDGEPPFGTLPDRDGEVERVADVAHAAEMFGFTARIGLDAGLAATVDWFRDSLQSSTGPKSTHG